MEAFKAEIIKEVRKELQKMKQEIVEGKKKNIYLYNQKMRWRLGVKYLKKLCNTGWPGNRKNRRMSEYKNRKKF